MALGRLWTSPKAIIVRKLLMSLIAVVMLTWFFSGIVRFPDSPIHPCRTDPGHLYVNSQSAYCGKQGQARTLSDFRLFQLWEVGVSSMWLPGMIVLVALGWGLPQGKRWTPT